MCVCVCVFFKRPMYINDNYETVGVYNARLIKYVEPTYIYILLYILIRTRIRAGEKNNREKPRKYEIHNTYYNNTILEYYTILLLYSVHPIASLVIFFSVSRRSV